MTPLLGQSRRSRPLSETDTMVNRGNEPSCGNRGLVGFPPAYLLTKILPQDQEVIKSSLLRHLLMQLIAQKIHLGFLSLQPESVYMELKS